MHNREGKLLVSTKQCGIELLQVFRKLLPLENRHVMNLLSKSFLLVVFYFKSWLVKLQVQSLKV